MFTKVKTRFAPSPTGLLHIGSVRTALYNYLFASKKDGEFILRIEDTDVKRSKKEYTQVIIEGLKWLGLNWHQGPFMQSERLDLYKEMCRKLEKNGKIYKCYCSREELADMREKSQKEEGFTGYDGRCRSISKRKAEDLEKEGRDFVWRLKTPSKENLVFEDMIKGKVEVNTDQIQDFVIVKSDGMPTYNFACVVDDAEMEISHIIRGDDHLSNTPKQILLYRALGKNTPSFAHLPQVHGTDGKRLSKRTGSVALNEYRKGGYLPEALRNYLALLGWSTSDSQQLFEWEELKQKFDISRVGKSAGVFDIEKLNWINGKYIRNMPAAELARRASFFLKKEKIIDDESNIPDKVVEAIELEREKIEKLTDIPRRIDFLLMDNITYNPKAVKKRLEKEGVEVILKDIKGVLEENQDFSKKGLEDSFRKYVKDKKIGAGKVFHPVRVAVSGRMKGPGVFDLLEFIGKKKCIERIEYALKEFVQ